MLSRRLLCLGILLLPTHPIFAAELSEVDRFRRFVEAASRDMLASSEPYFNKRINRWAKRKYEVARLKYDVKKTDSLVNPVVGVVAFSLTTTQTALFATKEEAEQSTVYDPASQNIFNVRLNFTYRNEVWSLSDGEEESVKPRLGKYEITPEGLLAEPDAIPHAALLFWLRSR